MASTLFLATCTDSSEPKKQRNAAAGAVSLAYATAADNPGLRSGLWSVDPDGDVAQVLDRLWHPLAVSRSGSVLAVPAKGYEERQVSNYSIADSEDVFELPDTASTHRCGAWSPDGSKLAYITTSETWKQSAENPWENDASIPVGSIWKLELAHKDIPTKLAEGLVPECLAWSPDSRNLAFVIGQQPGQTWEMHVVGDQNGVFPIEGMIQACTSASTNRRLVWDGAGVLFYVDGASLVRIAAGQRSVVGESNLLEAPYQEVVESRRKSWLALSAADQRRFLGQRGCSPGETLRLSPDGQVLAVGLGIGKYTALIRHDGTLIRAIAAGLFRGWAGNEGVLVIPDKPCQTCLFWFPVDDSKEQKELEDGFKRQVISDPEGAWFAYASEDEGQTGRALLFWDPEARQIGEVVLGHPVEPLAASTADGLVDVPTWGNE